MNIILDSKTLGDLICILEGQFAPLSTFMSESNWRSVCMTLKLTNGEFFPLPVTLAVNKDRYKIGNIVKLVDDTNYPLAELTIDELYTPDLDFECINAYGTNDRNHPYVRYKYTQKNKVYISGSLNNLINHVFMIF